jgi:hypothetical protein
MPSPYPSATGEQGLNEMLIWALQVLSFALEAHKEGILWICLHGLTKKWILIFK